MAVNTEELNKLRAAGYVVKCDQPTVTEGAWPAEALAITAMLVGRRLRSKVPGTAVTSKSSGRSILHARRRAARLDPAVSARQCTTFAKVEFGGVGRTLNTVFGSR